MWVQHRVLEVLAHTCGDHNVLKASPQRSLVGTEQKEHTSKHILHLVKP